MTHKQAESAREIKEVVKELREKLAATKALKTVVVYHSVSFLAPVGII